MQCHPYLAALPLLLATDGEGVAPGEGGLDISLTRNFGFVSNPPDCWMKSSRII